LTETMKTCCMHAFVLKTSPSLLSGRCAGAAGQHGHTRVVRSSFAGLAARVVQVCGAGWPTGSRQNPPHLHLYTTPSTASLPPSPTSLPSRSPLASHRNHRAVRAYPTTPHHFIPIPRTPRTPRPPLTFSPSPLPRLPTIATAPVHRPLTSPLPPCPHKTAPAPCLPSVPHRKLPVASLLRLPSSGVNPGHRRRPAVNPGANLDHRRHSGVNPGWWARCPPSGDHRWRRLMGTLIAAAGPG
jgi:hypothetical protein